MINFAAVFRVIQKLELDKGKKNNPCFKSLSLGGMHAMLRALACSPMPRACSAHVSCCGGSDEGRADLQKNMADNLAVSDFCINTHTHTHTHTFARPFSFSLIRRIARVIYKHFFKPARETAAFPLSAVFVFRRPMPCCRYCPLRPCCIMVSNSLRMPYYYHFTPDLLNGCTAFYCPEKRDTHESE